MNIIINIPEDLLKKGYIAYSACEITIDGEVLSDEILSSYELSKIMRHMKTSPFDVLRQEKWEYEFVDGVVYKVLKNTFNALNHDVLVYVKKEILEDYIELEEVEVYL